MGRQEGGNWRAAIQSGPGVVPVFADAAWKAIKPQAGSTLRETPANTDIVILTNDLDKYGSVVTKRSVAGTMNHLLEAPAEQGEAPSIDVYLQGVFGEKIAIAEMENPALGSGQDKIEVDEVDEDLVPGMTILLRVELASTAVVDWLAVVMAIDLGAMTDPDTLTIYPPLPAGADIASGFTAITASTHYKMNTASVTSVELPLLAFSRLYEDIDEYWTWYNCKVNQLTMDMTPGQILNLAFSILGAGELVADSQTGTVSIPPLSNPFLPLGMKLWIDDDEPVWISNMSLNYGNALEEKLALESETGIIGHAEGTKDITLGVNFEYEDRGYLDKARNATSMKTFFYGKRNVGTLVAPVYSYFACFGGNMVPTTIDTPVSARLMKYQLTLSAYRWLTGSDAFFMSFVGGNPPE
jgi:hypothetical protein